MKGVRICLFAFLLIATGCASRVAPDGGPKDEKPPELVEANPPQKTTNFNVTAISLKFDEFIELKEGGNNVFFSPPLSSKPIFKAQGKRLLVKFPQAPDSNLTYTIQFSGSISDITEKNLVKDITYVFSTGTYIDSSSLSGKVIDPFSLSPQKEIILLAYEEHPDSSIRKGLPRYVAISNESGDFTFIHLRKGKYRIFALKDDNSNFIYDGGTEMTGFWPNVVEIDSTHALKKPLLLFTEKPEKQRILKKEVGSSGKATYRLAKKADSVFIKTLYREEEIEIIQEETGRSDSLIYWFKPFPKDTLRIVFNTVNQDTSLSDTLLYRAKSNLAGGKKGAGSKPDTLLTVSLLLNNGMLNPGDTLFAKPNRPVASIDPDKFLLMREKDTLAQKIASGLEGNIQFKLNLYSALPDGYSYRIHVFPGALTDIYGRTNDTLRLSFQIPDKEELSTLRIELPLDSLPCERIAELLDEKNQVIKRLEHPKGKEVTFISLASGTYRLRLIDDCNGNKLWDTGHLIRMELPERVRYFPGTITIRGGWDQELIWEEKESQSNTIQSLPSK